MIRKVHHNQLLVNSALQFNLDKRVLIRLTVVSQIEDTEDFIGIERKTLRDMVIGVRDVLLKGAVKPALPSASSPKELRISNPRFEIPKSGSENQAHQ